MVWCVWLTAAHSVLSSLSLHSVPAGGRGLGQLLRGSAALGAGLLLLLPPEPAGARLGPHPPQHAQPPGLQQAGQQHTQEREVHPHGVQGGSLFLISGNNKNNNHITT